LYAASFSPQQGVLPLDHAAGSWGIDPTAATGCVLRDRAHGVASEAPLWGRHALNEAKARAGALCDVKEIESDDAWRGTSGRLCDDKPQSAARTGGHAWAADVDGLYARWNRTRGGAAFARLGAIANSGRVRAEGGRSVGREGTCSSRGVLLSAGRNPNLSKPESKDVNVSRRKKVLWLPRGIAKTRATSMWTPFARSLRPASRLAGRTTKRPHMREQGGYEYLAGESTHRDGSSWSTSCRSQHPFVGASGLREITF
jgi:hypothetical protein